MLCAYIWLLLSEWAHHTGTGHFQTGLHCSGGEYETRKEGKCLVEINLNLWRYHQFSISSCNIHHPCPGLVGVECRVSVRPCGRMSVHAAGCLSVSQGACPCDRWQQRAAAPRGRCRRHRSGRHREAATIPGASGTVRIERWQLQRPFSC